MQTYSNVAKLKQSDHGYDVDIFLYDTLTSIEEMVLNTARYQEGYTFQDILKMKMADAEIFTMLKGYSVAYPGAKLNLEGGGQLCLYKHVLMFDRYFFLELTKNEQDALIRRERVTIEHITRLKQNNTFQDVSGYILSHDYKACYTGVPPRVLKSALQKSKNFEFRLIKLLFKLDRIEQIFFSIVYYLLGMIRVDRISRLRMKNFKVIERHNKAKGKKYGHY